MKNSIRFFIGLSLLVLMACYGCGPGSSEKEMAAAQQAMDNAKNLHADELTPSDWKEAMKVWEQGQAAVKEGKSASTYFLRAKSRFEKTLTVAKAHANDISRDVSDIQLTIGERFSKVKAALEKGGVNPRIQKQIRPIVAEIEAGTESISNLLSQGEFLKARTIAREIQTKVYNVELIMAGKKPAI